MTNPLPKQVRALDRTGSPATVGHIMTANADGFFETALASGVITNTIELVVTQVLDFSGNVRNNVQVLFPWSVPEKLTNPGTLPTITSAGGVAWSPGGEYLAVAHDTSPYITIYQRTSQTFNKLTNPGVLPLNAGQDVAWSPDGEYLAVANSSTSPYITIYHRDGSSFTKLTNPGSLPAGNGRDVTWSPSGEFLVVGHDTTPFITIYQRTGVGASAVFTKLSNPAALPDGNTYGVDFSPNGEFLAVVGSGFLDIYKVSGDTFTKQTDPSPQPDGTGAKDVAWSPDSQFLVVAHSDGVITEARITAYERSESTFTKLADPISLPAGVVTYGVTWSPNGERLAVASSATPFLTIYQFDGSVFTKETDPSTVPTGISQGVGWSPNGEFLTVVHATTPFITTYQTGSTMPTSGTAIIKGSFKAGV